MAQGSRSSVNLQSLSVGAASSHSSEDDVDPAEGMHNSSSSYAEPSEGAKTTLQIKRDRADLDRRYVFLCPSALNKQFDSIPIPVRDSALLVFRCTRESIFPQSPVARRRSTVSRIDMGSQLRLSPRKESVNNDAISSLKTAKSSLAGALYRSEYSKDFLKWLTLKEKEACVFWYKPERDLHKLSAFFVDKLDPMTEHPYKPLQLDPHWWRVKFHRGNARFIGNPIHVVAAIAGTTGDQSSRSQDIDVLVLQELIYQSNPSLEPCAKYPFAPSIRYVPRSPRSVALPNDADGGAKGYIHYSRNRDTGGEDGSRIGAWPDKVRDRLDNLHVLWEAEAACRERQQNFALHGRSVVSPGSAR